MRGEPGGAEHQKSPPLRDTRWLPLLPVGLTPMCPSPAQVLSGGSGKSLLSFSSLPPQCFQAMSTLAIPCWKVAYKPQGIHGLTRPGRSRAERPRCGPQLVIHGECHYGEGYWGSGEDSPHSIPAVISNCRDLPLELLLFFIPCSLFCAVSGLCLLSQECLGAEGTSSTQATNVSNESNGKPTKSP